MPASRFFRGNLCPNASVITQDYVCASTANTRFIMKTTEPGDAGGSWQFSTIVVSAAASTFTAKTIAFATLVTQGLTLLAVTAGTGGNSITIAFTGGGTAGSEVVTVIGNAISVQIQSGVSTITQVRTAMQASGACTALVTTTGTSASTVATATALNLASGAASQFNTTTGVITATAVNGTQFPGQIGQLTTSTGTLPTGFALATNYFTYYPNSTWNGTTYGTATSFQLFNSVHALNAARQAYGNGVAPPTASGLVIPSADGTAGATVTFTPITITTATLTAQMSNDFLAGINPINLTALASTAAVGNVNNLNLTNPSNFVNMPTGLMYDASGAATVTAVNLFELTYRAGASKWVRTNLAITTGSMICRCIGYNG